jgi:hypothetical protein
MQFKDNFFLNIKLTFNHHNCCHSLDESRTKRYCNNKMIRSVNKKIYF